MQTKQQVDAITHWRSVHHCLVWVKPRDDSTRHSVSRIAVPRSRQVEPQRASVDVTRTDSILVSVGDLRSQPLKTNPPPAKPR